MAESELQFQTLVPLERFERGCVTVDVVEAEGDGEREPIGGAAVAAAGPDLSHLQASEVRRRVQGKGEEERG